MERKLEIRDAMFHLKTKEDAMSDFQNKRCKPCEGIGAPMPLKDVHKNLETMQGWNYEDSSGRLVRLYGFSNFYETMAFVNAVAWVANSENHHPDLEVSYGSCRVTLMTHALKGITENDFIVASKISALMDGDE